MEQQFQKNYDDDKSSSEELEIESSENQGNKKTEEERQNKGDIREFIEVGEFLDIFLGQKWISMVVQKIQLQELCLAQYNQEGQWFEFDFQTMRKQWIPGVKLHESYKLEVKNKHQGWMEATVLEASANSIKIHYNGYKKIYDEQIQLPSDSIAPIGYHTRAFGIGNILRQNPQLVNRFLHRFHTYLQIWNQYAVRRMYQRLEQSFPQILGEKGLMIKQVQGDGNCMFRAISDQLYGTEIYHAQLRGYALEYIYTESNFFQNFVMGQTITKYIEYKSKDGVWGDNIELQAFRELYNIPIEIYVYSTTPLKTGLENNPNNAQPIRLTYHGQSHYNSLKPIIGINNCLLQTQCGFVEESVLASLKQKKEQNQNLEVNDLVNQRKHFESLITQPTLMEDVFNESRRTFEEQMKKKEDEVLKSSLIVEEKSEEDQLLDLVMKESAQEVPQQSNHMQEEQIDAQIMKNIIEESKKNQEQEQVKQLQKILEDSELESILKESIKTHEQNMYHDPLSNPVIAQVMSMGNFQLDIVLEAYTVCGDDPDMIINYIYEHFI